MEDDLNDEVLLNSCLDLPLYSSQWNKLAANHSVRNLSNQSTGLLADQISDVQHNLGIGHHFDDFTTLPMFEPTLDFEAIMNFPL